MSEAGETGWSSTGASVGIGETARGPWFEEFEIGRVFDAAPAMSLSSGQAAAHQMIVGDRLRLALDDGLARRVTGSAPLAHPGLVTDVAIGQSTLATQHVRANLFYRGLVFHRFPLIGDTLRTVTTVEALRQNQRREGRLATGLVALRVTTVDQSDRPVLDFWRCAMIPLGNPGIQTGRADPMDAIGRPVSDRQFAAAVDDWDIAAAAGAWQGTIRFSDLRIGSSWTVAGGDLVSSAPELARLTLNVAAVHHDARAAGGRRLVYGGHTIGLATAQLCRALPDILTVTGWTSCDHVGPVYEGDTLRSTVAVERLVPLPQGGGVAHVRNRVSADIRCENGRDDDKADGRPVLDWRCAVVLP